MDMQDLIAPKDISEMLAHRHNRSQHPSIQKFRIGKTAVG
jgi:hypothetical protein